MSSHELKVPITCPACNRRSERRMRDTPPGTTITCACGAKITIAGDDMRPAQRAMDDLFKSLDKLGRRR